MNDTKLVSMANQIASFFRSYPEDEACTGIREHIQAFWTPKMREAIRADSANATLDPLVAEALHRWTGAENPIRKELGGPRLNGQMASDAG